MSYNVNRNVSFLPLFLFSFPYCFPCSLNWCFDFEYKDNAFIIDIPKTPTILLLINSIVAIFFIIEKIANHSLHCKINF